MNTRRRTLFRALLIGLAIAVPLVLLAMRTDAQARRICAAHGETLVEVREDGVLCTRDGGTAVRR